MLYANKCTHSKEGVVAFDFKKEYRDLYQPKTKPSIIEVPAMRFLAVEGEGDPNEAGGAYQRALELLYGMAYTLKMSYKTDHAIEGFYQYVVPPLEGFWWQPDVKGVDYANKAGFHWVSVIRVPEFVSEADYAWALEAATAKKKLDFSPVQLIEVDEGLCVQCMHVGPYDDEPATVEAMHAFAEAQGYVPDFSDVRRHHEIYLSDPRKADPAKMKTVVRHPVRKA
ncbi:MAG: GyrI-like domain-containing protein [Atopobiaceae bacterium]|nr:GyrI-like domain-containing protein [Atopobiaceae bacterium]